MRRFGNAVQQYYGQLIITTPAGASALTVSNPGAVGINPLSFSNSAGSGFLAMTSAGILQFGTSSTTQLQVLTNNTSRITVASTGGVSVLAPTSGVPFTVAGISGNFTAQFTAANVASSALGPIITAGTNQNDTAFRIRNAANSVTYLDLIGDGGLVMGLAAASSQGPGTISLSGGLFASAATLTAGSSTSLDVRTVAGQVAAIFHTPSDNQVQIDCLTGGQFSTLEFTNTAVIKSQIFWDNTGSLFKFTTLTDSITINGAAGGGVIVGAPTGSFKGVGTLNATGLFVNGVAVSTGSSALAATKAALTARASTTTLTNDPDLVVAIPGAGTYQVEVQFNAYCATTGNGISANLNYSGSFTQTASLFSFITSNGLAITGNAVISSAVGTTLIQSSAISTTINGSTGVTVLHATLVATGAGNLGFAWAQTASGVAATNVGAGSRMVVTKIA